MRILLTNDDGIYAPGMRSMRKELQKLGDVTVVAPAGEQSAVGHSITLLAPLITQEVLDENQTPMGYAVNAKPPVFVTRNGIVRKTSVSSTFWSSYSVTR